MSRVSQSRSCAFIEEDFSTPLRYDRNRKEVEIIEGNKTMVLASLPSNFLQENRFARLVGKYNSSFTIHN
jgi:hypothetical protein